MKITIDLPDELVEFFETSANLLDWGFENKENMLKHILLEGIEHRLEHIGSSQSLEQHRHFHMLINQERLNTHSPTFIDKVTKIEEDLLEEGSGSTD